MTLASRRLPGQDKRIFAVVTLKRAWRAARQILMGVWLWHLPQPHPHQDCVCPQSGQPQAFADVLGRVCVCPGCQVALGADLCQNPQAMSAQPNSSVVAVIGGGPAGLMAAETLAAGGARVDLYEANPSVGRKFLVAGKGGLNLTHAEAREAFLDRYGDRRPDLAQIIDAFDPAAVRAWAAGLGFETFVGSSGHVFPMDMKAAPLLRAWRQRLATSGVTVHVRHRWLGWGTDGTLRFATPDGERTAAPDAAILALGGGSWPQTGSDGVWVSLLAACGVAVAPLRPANCGFDAAWSDHFRERFAGAPLQTVEIRFEDRPDRPFHGRGACVITATGIEGSLIYAASARLRDALETAGAATLFLDLAPDRTAAQLAERLRRPRGSRSLSSHVARQAGLKGVKMGLLRELAADVDLADPDRLAAAIKRLPLRLLAPRPLAEAISSAGGVPFAALDQRLMLRAAARGLLRRGDAGLGDAHRRLSAHGLLCHRPLGRPRCAGLVGRKSSTFPTRD